MTHSLAPAIELVCCQQSFIRATIPDLVHALVEQSRSDFRL